MRTTRGGERKWGDRGRPRDSQLVTQNTESRRILDFCKSEIAGLRSDVRGHDREVKETDGVDVAMMEVSLRESLDKGLAGKGEKSGRGTAKNARLKALGSKLEPAPSHALHLNQLVNVSNWKVPPRIPDSSAKLGVRFSVATLGSSCLAFC